MIFTRIIVQSIKNCAAWLSRYLLSGFADLNDEAFDGEVVALERLREGLAVDGFDDVFCGDDDDGLDDGDDDIFAFSDGDDDGLGDGDVFCNGDNDGLGDGPVEVASNALIVPNIPEWTEQ